MKGVVASEIVTAIRGDGQHLWNGVAAWPAEMYPSARRPADQRVCRLDTSLYTMLRGSSIEAMPMQPERHRNLQTEFYDSLRTA